MKRIHLQKAKTQIARSDTIRRINKQIVLNYVRDRAPISRADIARETDLQRSTVSAIIDELHESGLIEEIGVGSSTGGRKPTLLKLRVDVPVAVGIDITPRLTTIMLADLAGKILEKDSFQTSPDLDFMNETILAKVSRLKAKTKSKNLGVGISVPGITDQISDRVIYSPYFQWMDWDIGKLISRETGFAVMVDNDANTLALAELWFGGEEIRKIRNFMTVLVGEGVGTGIVFDGQVYRGEKGSAGEFGHMIIGRNAPAKCSCGSFECWEAHASNTATINRYKNFKGMSNGYELTFVDLVERAAGGEEPAVRAIKETAKYLGIGISNLIVGLSPQAIIVGGGITKVWNLIADELGFLINRSVSGKLPETDLIASTLGDYPTQIGAISLVLAQKFALNR